MLNSKQLLYLVIGLLVAMVVVGGFLAVPAYRQASQLKARTANLQEKIDGLTGQTEELQQLAVALSAMNEQLDSELKTIPCVPDIADLIRKLSLPVDGVTIRDQTFTAGSVGEAVAGKENPARVMPLTIDMVARFDSVFALIQAAESMPRLVRVASVRMEVEHGQEETDESFLIASVGLEAVYEPDGGEEGS
ncbi:MAG: type 4a pilus biogenesis protein PilO [Phycisphaerales bacterium]|nr:MAG: type 4a pilus biogenesis protein PilO [Phycisphaerales bacterium]